MSGDVSARKDKKGQFVCVSVYLHKENTILQNRYAYKEIETVSKGKTFAHHPMRICVSVVSKEITALVQKAANDFF